MGKEARRVARSVSSELQSLPKVSSGIVGLDEVLQGGFPEGRTTILTNQLAGNYMQQDFSGVGFSSLVDAIVLLQFVPIDGEFTRGLLILKSRGSKHSHSYHQYLITDDGIRIAEMPSGARPDMMGVLLAAAQPAAALSAM